MKDSIESGHNKIFIHTNLKRGLPLENINKVAGPFVEAWAMEQFENIADNAGNIYELIHAEPGKRLDPFDIILQFRVPKHETEYVSANVDVKATAEDIANSGKSPNITSYARIRSEYVRDPDYIFIILSLKHRVFSEKQADTGMTNGIMEVVSYSVYDIKYIAPRDLGYNPALGTGQLQIRDIHYVEVVSRTAWEFCQMLTRNLSAQGVRRRGWQWQLSMVGLRQMNQQQVPPTLLLVDDMAASSNGFKSHFERGGYRVVTAHDEENAATVSRIFPPDLILICSVIPPSDYFEVASRISHSCVQCSDVPVVVFADRASPVVSEGGEVSLGQNVYTILPEDFDQLESYLGRLREALKKAA